MKKTKARLWTHPEFKKMCKKKAAELDITIEEYTRILANDMNRKKRRKYEFDF